MRIEFPGEDTIPGLRQLWQIAFGDSDAFLDGFFRTGFDRQRCRCMQENGLVAAALYWFDVSCGGAPMAYLYAVATHPDFRGQGLCRKLMADVREELTRRGYVGILLVPEGDRLRRMYAGMGYRSCTQIREFSCIAGTQAAEMTPIEGAEYARLRRQFLPAGSVLQEGPGLDFLAGYAAFYRGEDFLAALVAEEDSLFCPELLGNPGAAAAICTTLGKRHGTFRTPGSGTEFAMFLPLRPDSPVPDYFAFAYD